MTKSLKGLGKEETLAYLKKIEEKIIKEKNVRIMFLGGTEVFLSRLNFPEGFDNEVVYMSMNSKKNPLQFLIANTIFKSKEFKAVVKYVYNEEKNLYLLRVIDFDNSSLMISE